MRTLSPRSEEADLARMALAACEEGDHARLREILSQEPDFDVNITDGKNGASLLVTTILHNHIECAKLLIEAKANIDVACGQDNETALHVCCARGRKEMTRLLLEAGAELNPEDMLGRSPLLMSCLLDKSECTALMLKSKANIEQPMTKRNPGATPLYAAALKGSTKCVTLLCEASANPNAQNRDGATPLMVSCQEGHLEVSMILSSYGSSREMRPWKGFLPKSGSWAEELAKRSGNNQLVRWLKESTVCGSSACPPACLSTPLPDCLTAASQCHACLRL